MTTERKNQIKKALENAEVALAAGGEVAFAKAADAVEMTAAKPAPKAKAVKPAKEPKVKKLAASAIEIDAAEFVKAHSKAPGTGKRDPNAVWKFLIGERAVEIATEFYRDAKAKALEAAIAANANKVQLLA